MKLYIKNMVCNRCKTTVKSELDKIGIQYDTVRIGEVTTEKKNHFRTAGTTIGSITAKRGSN